MSRLGPPSRITAGVEGHPAAVALRHLGLRSVPVSVEVLKAHPKSTVCRLRGVAWGGRDSVIAKNIKRSSPGIERAVYERILPRLEIDSLAYLGSVDDIASDTVWLFLEDAGDTGFTFSSKEHRALFISWLARFHAASLPRDLQEILPDRGTDHVLWQLAQASEKIRSSLESPYLLADDVRLLQEVDARLHAVRSQWSAIRGFDDLLPKRFVHGDLVPKNLRVREGREGLRLSVLDWETAGWGSPCVDMGGLFAAIPGSELGPYAEIVERRDPHEACPSLERMRRDGLLFRTIAAIYWESHGLVHDRRERIARRMASYNDALRSALHAIRSEGAPSGRPGADHPC